MACILIPSLQLQMRIIVRPYLFRIWIRVQATLAQT